MGVKLAVIGGGSTYTPELVEGLAARAGRLPVDELVLLDPDATRLEVVGGLARRMLDQAGWQGTLVLTSEQARALDGAAFVVVQLRVGGQLARLAKALRTVPVVLELAEEVGRRAADGAWIIDFTNPTGIVTQALLDHGHRAIGLCNVAIGFHRRFAREFGVTAERVRLEHVGLNHLSWERAVLVDGRDVLPQILERDSEALAEDLHVPASLIRSMGAIPSYYLRYYYCTDQVLEEQRSGPARAQEVMEIERGLLELYRDPELREKPKLLERRGGAYYSEAAAELAASLFDGRGDPQVVNVRNDGAVPGLTNTDVVEVAATVDADGAHPLALGSVAPEMLGLIQHVKAYERLAVDAAVSGDRSVALKALVTNPLVGQYSKAAPLLDALLEENRAFLPRFFPS